MGTRRIESPELAGLQERVARETKRNREQTSPRHGPKVEEVVIKLGCSLGRNPIELREASWL
jgi:hypothetical protein